MTDKLIKIQKIITIKDFQNNRENFIYLFEVQFPPKEIKLFKERYNFELGTLLVGDLLLDLEKERMLEIHPFPEWVVHLKTESKCKPYLVVPNFSKAFINKLLRKPLHVKLDLLKNCISSLEIENLIAFEYEEGINLLIPAYIPHFFISSKIDKECGEQPPYLQVFEPNFADIAKVLRIKPSYYFKLSFYAEI